MGSDDESNHTYPTPRIVVQVDSNDVKKDLNQSLEKEVLESSSLSGSVVSIPTRSFIPSTVFGAFMPVAIFSNLLGMYPGRWIYKSILKRRIGPQNKHDSQEVEKYYGAREPLSFLIPCTVVGQTFLMWHHEWPILFDLLGEMPWFDYYSAVLSYIAVGISATVSYIGMQYQYKSITRLLIKLNSVDPLLDPIGINRSSGISSLLICGLGVLPFTFVMARYIFKFKKDFPIDANLSDYVFAICLGYGEVMDVVVLVHIFFFADALKRRYSSLSCGVSYVANQLQLHQQRRRMPPGVTEMTAYTQQQQQQGKQDVTTGQHEENLPHFVTLASLTTMGHSRPTAIQGVLEQETSETLFRARLVHHELSGVSREVSSLYGPVLVVHVGMLVFRMFVAFLVLYWKDDERRTFRLFFAFITFTYFARLVIVVSKVEGAAQQANCSSDDLYKIRMAEVGPDCQAEITATIQQQSTQSLQINAGNFFPLNKGILTTIAGVLATNVILIAKLKLNANLETCTRED